MESAHSTPKHVLNVDLKITLIICHPDDVLVHFQGKYNSECEFDYHILQNEIQHVHKEKENIDIGAFCLVQDKPYGEWHRGKVVNKINEVYEALLIDQGDIVKVGSIQIAAACGELFTLPPKVVKGVFSNILPFRNKWTPKAVNYFSSLAGLHVKGRVQTFPSHQVVLLEVPNIISHVVELNLAKYVDTDTFCLLVEILHKFPIYSHCKQMPDLLQQKMLLPEMSSNLEDNQPSFQKILDHLRPQLSVGIIQKVKISAAIGPNKFYCHILSWEEELNNLTTTMCTHYEAINKEQNSVLDNLGVLCAAKCIDGLWRRGVIQKIVSAEEVKVWFIDFGSSEIVSSAKVKSLQPGFLSLSMMAIPCSLLEVNSHTESVRNAQLIQFKQGLLGKILIAFIDHFCKKEQVFYVKLYNHTYELSDQCHLTKECVPVLSPNAYTEISETSDTEAKNKIPSTTTTLAENESVSYRTVQLDVDSVHVVYIEYVLNPSNFWIRPDQYQNEFYDMMANIAAVYNPFKPTESVLENPKQGELCCALYEKDQHYYRAIVTEVIGACVSVYFIDFGNTETVASSDVKTLLPQFRVLPALAVCCTLAHIYPVEDVWVKSANDFFKDSTAGKALLCHIFSKQKYKYVVDVRHSENLNNSNIDTLLVQAGYAQYWKVNLGAADPDTTKNWQIKNTDDKSNVEKQTICISLQNSISLNVSDTGANVSVSNSHISTKGIATLCSQPDRPRKPNIAALQYKECIFKPGTSMDIICSHVISPGNFWCQQYSKVSELKSLMNELNNYYSTCNNMDWQGQKVCIAYFNGQFYRAFVINYINAKEIELIFVDYGNRENVFASDLREITPEFIKLEGQAFHCSLNHFIAPANTHTGWSFDACQDFKTVVNSAAGKLKCTIHALFSKSTDLCNAVSLKTPFNNVCHFLVLKGHAVYSQSSLLSSKLHSFSYSEFDLLVGNKEQVVITYIYNTSKFYCQLAKNTEAVEILMKKVSKIGKEQKTERCSRTNRLCIVKYFEDGNYYRALTWPVESSDFFVAFFVDFGNSQMVTEHEMLPIPKEATDILADPMQAIQCYLFDLKDVILTAEVKKWFEECCIGKLLNAVIKTKECDGTLGLELYSENGQINQKIKQLLCMNLNSENPETMLKTESENAHSQTHTPKSYKGKNQLNAVSSNDSKENLLPLKRNKISLEVSKEGLNKYLTHESCLQSFDNTKTAVQDDVSSAKDASRNFIKCCDLPQVLIEPGSTRVVYVSHINNPSNFYIHLAENEQKIVQLADELNEEPMTAQHFAGNSFKKGDLVVAEYAEDLAFYRAEVKEVGEDNLFDVEFIDYGNTSKVKSTNMFKPPDTFLTIPKLCIWAFLSRVKDLQYKGEWSKDVTSYFSEKVSGKPVCCTFLSIHGTQWEVDITWKGQSIAAELHQCFGAAIQRNSSSRREEHNISSKADLGSLVKACSTIEQENVPTTDECSYQVQSQRLQPGQLKKVKNIYFSDGGKFFVTLDGNSLAHNNLSLLIADAVKQANNRLAPRNITKGMICLAKSNLMQTWFRACVEEIYPNNIKMLVHFIDVGMSEMVSMHNAKKLTGDIISVPKQAVPCKWVWLEKTGEALFKKALNSHLEKQVQILILHFIVSCNSWKVEILVNGSLFREYCNLEFHQFTKREAVPSYNSEERALFSPKCAIPFDPLQRLKLYPGFVTSVNDPSDFYIQLGNSIDSMKNILLMLSKLSDTILPLPDEFLKPGCSCLIKCFMEEEWCRSRIVKVTDEAVLLFLFDYGVFKTIPLSDIDKLKMIPSDLANLPMLTYPCTLHGVIPSDKKQWSKEATNLFTHCVKSHNLMFQLVKYNSKNTLEVNIYDEDSLAQTLVAMGHARFSDQALNHTITEKTVSSKMSNGGLKLNVARTRLSNLRCNEVEKKECSPPSPVMFDSVAQYADHELLHESDLQKLECSQCSNKKSQYCVAYEEKLQS